MKSNSIEEKRYLNTYTIKRILPSSVDAISYDLLTGMKRYLGIEHQDDDNELLTYLRKQVGLRQELTVLQ
jgi:hypothetical protein